MKLCHLGGNGPLTKPSAKHEDFLLSCWPGESKRPQTKQDVSFLALGTLHKMKVTPNC